MSNTGREFYLLACWRVPLRMYGVPTYDSFRATPGTGDLQPRRTRKSLSFGSRGMGSHDKVQNRFFQHTITIIGL